MARVAVLLSLAVGLSLWGVERVRESMLFVHESDARIAADMVSVSSGVAGRVVERPAGSGSRVARGDALAVIDSRDARARLAVLEAELALLGAGAGVRGSGPAFPEGGVRAARRALLLARIRRHRGEVADHVVRSPRDGVVSRTFVEQGEYVEPGQRIALLHDPLAVYVEANVRETGIRRLRPGQRVRVEVDAYPDRTFEGRVVRIGAAATSTFALLPSPNPSGSFTKVTQRFPVRIAVEQDGERLRPGMMVEVFIRTGDG